MEYCSNCLHYDGENQILQCKTGCYGNQYPQDHGCWQWKPITNENVEK